MKNKKEQAIRYIPEYSIITGSVQAGLLLSQLAYWAEMMKGKPFYKTNAQLSNELGMTAQQIRRAKKTLLSQKLISIELKGMPNKSFYSVHTNKLVCSPEHNVLVSGTQRAGLENTTLCSQEHTNINKEYKENINKEGSDDFFALRAFYLEALKKERAIDLAESDVDGEVLNRLLEKYELEKLKPSIELFLRADDSSPTWAIRQFEYHYAKNKYRPTKKELIPSHLKVTQGIY
jgi:hypothetical protein